MNDQGQEQTRLLNEATWAIRNYLNAFSPGDDISLGIAEQEADDIIDSLIGRTFAVEKAALKADEL